eukprot:11881800-Alexandrium_andersonii.AAC.1
MSALRTRSSAIMDKGCARTRALEMVFSLSELECDPCVRVCVQRVAAMRRAWHRRPDLRESIEHSRLTYACGD